MSSCSSNRRRMTPEKSLRSACECVCYLVCYACVSRDIRVNHNQPSPSCRRACQSPALCGPRMHYSSMAAIVYALPPASAVVVGLGVGMVACLLCACGLCCCPSCVCIISSSQKHSSHACGMLFTAGNIAAGYHPLTLCGRCPLPPNSPTHSSTHPVH